MTEAISPGQPCVNISLSGCSSSSGLFDLPLLATRGLPELLSSFSNRWFPLRKLFTNSLSKLHYWKVWNIRQFSAGSSQLRIEERDQGWYLVAVRKCCNMQWIPPRQHSKRTRTTHSARIGKTGKTTSMVAPPLDDQPNQTHLTHSCDRRRSCRARLAKPLSALSLLSLWRQLRNAKRTLRCS